MSEPRFLLARMAIVSALCALGTAVSPAAAQSYPAQPIRIVVPAAAGTPPDIISRLIAQDLGSSESWQVIVENKPGAMHTLGAGEVLRQPADGHTILAITLLTTVAPSLLPNTKFRLDRDFVPVIKLASAHHVLVVNPSVPAKSFPELIALLKAQPDKYRFSSGGFGTPAHLTGELFKLKINARTTHVPYQALPRAIADLINGTNHFQFITPLPALELIAAGKLRALAVTGPNRLPSLKDVPTVVEQGFPDLVIQDWAGLLVKSGTPDEVVGRLNRAINASLAKPHVRAALAKLSAEPAGGASADFGKFVRGQMTYWAGVVRDAKIKVHQ